MYRIDADTHISCEKTDNRISAEELLLHLDAAHMDKALVWLHPNGGAALLQRYGYRSFRRKYVYLHRSCT